MNIFSFISKKQARIMTLVCVVFCSILIVEPAFADIGSDINNQLQAIAGKKGGNLGPGTDPRLIAAQMIRRGLTILGTLMLIYTFWGGWLIMTAAGESEPIEKGKKTLTRAVIGLILILSSYSITLLTARLIDVDQNPQNQIPNNDRQQEGLINNDPLNQDATPFVF